MEQLEREQREYFAQHPDEAAQLLKVGAGTASTKMDNVTFAARTVMALALQNHDGTIMAR